jgi:rSAM/selenodomain-associated transferase 1
VLVCVLAKAPRPGFAKTRLCPPCTPEQAAILAAACLADTLAAVARTPAHRRVIALDGRPGDWLPSDFEVVAQADGDLGARIEAAVADGFDRGADGPVVLIGMDTPQVRPADLLAVAHALDAPVDPLDAVLGPTADGGYWVIGLRRPVPNICDGVPMSTPGTADAQRRVLVARGCRVGCTTELVDVDDIVSARAVASSAPGTAFARALGSMSFGSDR